MYPSWLAAGATLLAVAGTAVAQNANMEERIRAAMADSLRSQQASIGLQVQHQQKQQRAAAPRMRATNLAAPTSIAAQSFPRPLCLPVPAEDLQPQIEQAATEHGVSPNLLLAVARAESAFVPCAVSPKGARGMMQIMPATGRDLGLVNPWDSQQSLTAGAKYLRQLLDRYNGDLRLALGAYNAGPARVDQYGDVPPIDETRSYVQKILSEFNTSEPFEEIPRIPIP